MHTHTPLLPLQDYWRRRVSVPKIAAGFWACVKTHVQRLQQDMRAAPSETLLFVASDQKMARTAASQALAKLGKDIGADLQKRVDDSKMSIRERLRKQEDELAAKRKKPGEA
jgi:hypothetical protein